MMNAFTYITRACPRNCDYCSIKSGSKSRGRMTEEDWIDAFAILKDIGVTFNLILGNETWLLGEKLLRILEKNEVPFALYTTAPPKLFEKYREKFFGSGVIDNLTCGIDYSIKYLMALRRPLTDTEQKSYDGWKALIWAKGHYPDLDMQGNITVYQQNYRQLINLVTELTELSVFQGVNLIQWNRDEKYDFFPNKEAMKDYLFKEKDLDRLLIQFRTVLTRPHLLHHPEVLNLTPEILKEMVAMNWHCGGNPYGGPTIDSDGSLRCCGYRKGTVTPQFLISDLAYPSQLKNWKNAVFFDAMECPGCSWSFPRMFAHWSETDEKFGRDVFTKHAGKHVPEDKLPQRKVE